VDRASQCRWVAHKERTGKVITDQIAVQVAGRYLRQLIEEGYDSQREIYTVAVAMSSAISMLW